MLNSYVYLCNLINLMKNFVNCVDRYIPIPTNLRHYGNEKKQKPSMHHHSHHLQFQMTHWRSKDGGRGGPPRAARARGGILRGHFIPLCQITVTLSV